MAEADRVGASHPALEQPVRHGTHFIARSCTKPLATSSPRICPALSRALEATVSSVRLGFSAALAAPPIHPARLDPDRVPAVGGHPKELARVGATGVHDPDLFLAAAVAVVDDPAAVGRIAGMFVRLPAVIAGELDRSPLGIGGIPDLDHKDIVVALLVGGVGDPAAIERPGLIVGLAVAHKGQARVGPAILGREMEVEPPVVVLLLNDGETPVRRSPLPRQEQVVGPRAGKIGQAGPVRVDDEDPLLRPNRSHLKAILPIRTSGIAVGVRVGVRVGLT